MCLITWTRMGRNAEGIRSNLAIEMAPPSAPCGRVHVPEYHNQNTSQTEHSNSKGTQQAATFNH